MSSVKTPETPYYMVSLKYKLNPGVEGEYQSLNKELEEMSDKQPGFLGMEEVTDTKDNTTINLSYWKDEDSIVNWKHNSKHLQAQEKARTDFYSHYEFRIAKVERDYEFTSHKASH
ncbi:uncharacterized protein J8A68_005414 [[Candida] subhashii]|uniref:ABM domain-containing protein n=1 Tax=[Candida] subhashii TaxID=561895 RepID=A0A8J5QGU9_9ASCO|nr:uncharacterized protein J8A68_005414 [[Candida] subhashii]KAG7661042.1 hypothetical protein J8A68_005414 [[Candida] subhashii]